MIDYVDLISKFIEASILGSGWVVLFLKYFFLDKQTRTQIKNAEQEKYRKMVLEDLQPIYKSYTNKLIDIVGNNFVATKDTIVEFDDIADRLFRFGNDLADAMLKKYIEISQNNLNVIRDLMKDKHDLKDNIMIEHFMASNILKANNLNMNNTLQFNYQRFNSMFKVYKKYIFNKENSLWFRIKFFCKK